MALYSVGVCVEGTNNTNEKEVLSLYRGSITTSGILYSDFKQDTGKIKGFKKSFTAIKVLGNSGRIRNNLVR